MMQRHRVLGTIAATLPALSIVPRRTRLHQRISPKGTERTDYPARSPLHVFSLPALMAARPTILIRVATGVIRAGHATLATARRLIVPRVRRVLRLGIGVFVFACFTSIGRVLLGRAGGDRCTLLRIIRAARDIGITRIAVVLALFGHWMLHPSWLGLPSLCDASPVPEGQWGGFAQ